VSRTDSSLFRQTAGKVWKKNIWYVKLFYFTSYAWYYLLELPGGL